MLAYGSRVLNDRRLAIINIGWILNLAYLISILVFSKVNPPEYIKTSLISYLDIFSCFFFLVACSKQINNQPYLWLNKYPLLFFLLMALFAGLRAYPSKGLQVGIITVFPNNIPAVIIDYFAVRSTAIFFQKKTLRFIGFSKYIYKATMLYAFIQFYSILTISLLNHFSILGIEIDNDSIGMTLGFVAKFIILLAIVVYIVVEKETQLFEKNRGLEDKMYKLELQTKKLFAERLNLIIGRTFHEITPPLQQMEYIINNLNDSDPSKREDIPVGKKVRNELDKVESAIHRMRVILTASSKMYHTDLINLSPETTEINFPIPIEEEEGLQNINTLIEVAIMNFKSANFNNDYHVTNKLRFIAEYGASCEIRCNTVQMVQVFYNIYKNSFEAMLEQNVAGTILIKTTNNIEDGNKRIRIEIEDDGPGIPVENLEKIFQEGFSTKQHSGKGRGYGLEIVKNYTELNGGELRLESPPENPYLKAKSTHGTKFILSFLKQSKILNKI